MDPTQPSFYDPLPIDSNGFACAPLDSDTAFDASTGLDVPLESDPDALPLAASDPDYDPFIDDATPDADTTSADQPFGLRLRQKARSLLQKQKRVAPPTYRQIADQIRAQLQKEAIQALLAAEQGQKLGASVGTGVGAGLGH